LIGDAAEGLGAPHPDADAVDLWQEVGLEPWRLDGWPGAAPDLAVLGYWAERRQEVLSVRARADAYLHALPEAIRKDLWAGMRRRILQAHRKQEI
jgi:hypothetical protein